MPRTDKWSGFKSVSVSQQLNRIEELLDIHPRTQRVIPLNPTIEEQATKHE